jgi:hypothetical protein
MGRVLVGRAKGLERERWGKRETVGREDTVQVELKR